MITETGKSMALVTEEALIEFSNALPRQEHLLVAGIKGWYDQIANLRVFGRTGAGVIARHDRQSMKLIQKEEITDDDIVMAIGTTFSYLGIPSEALLELHQHAKSKKTFTFPAPLNKTVVFD
jgi:hypothetical protein